MSTGQTDPNAKQKPKEDDCVCPQCNVALQTPIRDASKSEFPAFCMECYLPLLIVAQKYTIQKKLGEGGGGVVYLAKHRHLTLNPLRVIKFINPKLLEKEVARKRFNREIQVTSVLSQENHHIVRIFDDFGIVAGLGHFYVMEYLDGQDLEEYIKQVKIIPMSAVFSIFTQLCEAIHAAHEVDIIHRDLKPSNIILLQKKTNEHFVKVMDFGLAKQLSGERVTIASNRTIGTPLYMAPEQFEGSHHLDHRVDIYAMGTVLYEMLLGHNPFLAPDQEEGMTLLELAKAKYQNERIPFGSSYAIRAIPLEIEEFVHTTLAQDPNERFSSVLEMQNIFKQLEPYFIDESAAATSPIEIKSPLLSDLALTESTEHQLLSEGEEAITPLQLDSSESILNRTDSSPDLHSLQENILKQHQSSPPDYSIEVVPNIIAIDVEKSPSVEGRETPELDTATIQEFPKMSYEEALQYKQTPSQEALEHAGTLPEIRSEVATFDPISIPAVEDKQRTIPVAGPREARTGHRVVTYPTTGHGQPSSVIIEQSFLSSLDRKTEPLSELEKKHASTVEIQRKQKPTTQVVMMPESEAKSFPFLRIVLMGSIFILLCILFLVFLQRG